MSSRKVLCGVVLATWAGVVSVAAGAGASKDDLIRELMASLDLKQKQIDSLKVEVSQLKGELAKLKGELAQARSGGAATPVTPAVPARPAPVVPAPPSRPPAVPEKLVPPAVSPAAADHRPAPRDGAVAPRVALEQKITRLELHGQTLEEALEAIAQNQKFNLWVKWNQLAAAGVDRKAKIRLPLNNVSVAKALEMVLSEAATTAEIQHSVQDEYVVIAPARDLPGPLELKTYDVKDLVGSNRQTAFKLINTIKSTIDPKVWKDPLHHIRESQGRLIIMTNTRNHRAIQDLLKTIREQEQR